MRLTTFTLVAIDCAQDLREVARAAGRPLNVRAVIARLAPSRVLPVAPGPALETTVERVLERLRSHPTGPPIPAPGKLVEQARRRVLGQR